MSDQVGLLCLDERALEREEAGTMIAGTSGQLPFLAPPKLMDEFLAKKMSLDVATSIAATSTKSKTTINNNNNSNNNTQEQSSNASTQQNLWVTNVQQDHSAPGSPGEPTFSYLLAFILIDGRRYPSIVLGGEPRVPYQMFLKLYSHIYDRDMMELAADELQIAQKVATPDQVRRLLDQDANLAANLNSKTSLTLVSNSDIERILSRIRKGEELRNDHEISGDRITVVQNMFDDEELRGILVPDRRDERNIVCEKCSHWFKPEEFAVHSHSDNLENIMVVHWGLFGNKWRYMIRLPDDADEKSKRSYMNFLNRGLNSDDERRILTKSLKRTLADDDGMDFCSGSSASEADQPFLTRWPPKHPKYEENCTNAGIEKDWLAFHYKELRFLKKTLLEAANGLIPGIDPNGTIEDMRRQARALLPQSFPDYRRAQIPTAPKIMKSLRVYEDKNDTFLQLLHSATAAFKPAADLLSQPKPKPTKAHSDGILHPTALKAVPSTMSTFLPPKPMRSSQQPSSSKAKEIKEQENSIALLTAMTADTSLGGASSSTSTSKSSAMVIDPFLYNLQMRLLYAGIQALGRPRS